MTNLDTKGGLEHLLVSGDYQDMGSIQNNVEALNAFGDFVNSAYETSDTTVIFNGDMIDSHALDSIHYDSEALSEENLKLIPDEMVKKFIDMQGGNEEEFDNLPPEHLSQVKSILAGQVYTQKINQSLKTKFVEQGYSVKMVTGNNEVQTLFRGQDISKNIEEATQKYRELTSQQTGAEFIDDREIREVGGMKVFSTPYWGIGYQGGESLMQFHDDPDVEKSEVYQKLKDTEVKKGEEMIFALHGRPAEGQNWGLSQYLKGVEGTVWVTHGHQGKPGITRETTEAGGDIIYINSNNNPDHGINPEQTFYDLEVKSGKVNKVVEYKLKYKDAA